LSTSVGAAAVPVPNAAQEVVLLETLKTLLTEAIRAFTRWDPANLAEVSGAINATASDVMAASLNLACASLTPEAQLQRRTLLAELRQQHVFFQAMLRRWRRSILLRQQLLDLAQEPATYTESLDSRWYCHE